MKTKRNHAKTTEGYVSSFEVIILTIDAVGVRFEKEKKYKKKGFHEKSN